MNNVVVSTHDKVFLKMENVSWNIFENDWNDIVAKTVSELPPSTDVYMLEAFSPKDDSIFSPKHGQSFDFILDSVLRQQACQLSLTDEDHIFWVMDIKRLLPRLRVCIHLTTIKSAQLAAHLREFINSVTSETQELDDVYRGYIQSLSLQKL